MSEAMTRMVEGTHVNFLRNITDKRARISTDRMRETPATRDVLRESGMQTADTYIGHGQRKVVQWVDLIPIFKVCALHQGFEGGGRWRKP